ncbi:creatininase family protein [Variovorax sp. EL159]|uniref:creatininase family protein n=1 Tax=Variovorax sp. EL159 TaxID=1566270 RepID=UPI00088CE7A3|nr:creatininase family protein [Variovorax sp. EL159]SCX72562.1 creatinine amidohydrolase [Variovorax sp. EL159]
MNSQRADNEGRQFAGPVGPTRWGGFKSPDFSRVDVSSTMVILPIGSTEQHGPHLPVEVDSLLVSEVAHRAAALAPALVLPTLWVSLAEHHMAYAGSLTLDFETLLAFVRCVVRSLKRQGFRRILLLNGHGGNMAALTLVVDKLSAEFELPLATATYWNVAAKDFAAILEGQPNLLHACEAETSMVMFLRPDLVDAQAACTVASAPTGFLQEGGIHRWRDMSHWSRSGVVGTPRLASAMKGERLLEAAASALADQFARGAIWGDEMVKPSPV